MRTIFGIGAALATGAFALMSAPQPAYAIKCEGIVQINKTSRVITPYCEHEEMARIARTYGIRTTGRQLRTNVNYKRRICEHIGHDSRLSSVCGGLRLEDRGGGRYQG